MAKGESLYTFPKLMGSGNYKKWSRDMAFALQEAELWNYVTGARKMPREIPPPPQKADETPPEETEKQLEKRDKRDLERLISGASWVLFPEHSLIVQTIWGFEVSLASLLSQTRSRWPILLHFLHVALLCLHFLE